MSEDTKDISYEEALKEAYGSTDSFEISKKVNEELLKENMKLRTVNNVLSKLNLTVCAILYGFVIGLWASKFMRE